MRVVTPTDASGSWRTARSAIFKKFAMSKKPEPQPK